MKCILNPKHDCFCRNRDERMRRISDLVDEYMKLHIEITDHPKKTINPTSTNSQGRFKKGAWGSK